MKIHARPQRRVRTIILVGSAAVLIWLVVSRSLAAYLADVSPRSALWLNPRQPQALVNLADRSINPFESAASLPIEVPGRILQDDDKATVSAPAVSWNPNQAFKIGERNPSVDLPAIRAWVESAMMNAPLNARALQILGQAASISNDDRKASKYMEAAARLSLHESIADYWVMRKSADAGDYKRAIFYADALLRTKPGLIQYVEPLLAHFAEQKASNGPLKSMLKTNPPWRNSFFANLPRYISDARTPLDLLLALRTSAAPPNSAEIDGYLNFLIAHKFYELAYYTWLQFLPPAVLRTAGLLFNGNFETPPSGSPFDWAISQGSGVAVDIVPTSGKIDEHALLLDFLYGRVDYHSVTELVLLAPGTYRFTARYQGKLVGPRGLKWRIVCAGDAQTRIGESPMIIGTNSTWQNVGFAFTVPAPDCPAQYVRLDLDARMASEALVTGSILFDDLHIARVANPPAVRETAK